MADAATTAAHAGGTSQPRSFERWAAGQVEQRVPALELAAIMDVGRHFPLPYVLILLGTVYLLHQSVPSGTLFIWAAVYAAYIAARTAFTSAYFRDAGRLTVARWRAGVVVSAVCHGLLLGSLAFIGLPHLSADEGMALTVGVICVSAAGIVYTALHLPALNLLTVFALLPYVVGWQLRQHGGGMHPAAVVVLGLLAVFLHLNRTHHRQLKHNLVLRATQELLLDDQAHKNSQLEQAHIARTRLLATASHDLRQPVHTLGLLIARLDADMPAAQLNARLAQIEHACSIVSDMLGELMDLSQLDNRGYQSRVCAIELDTLLEQVRLTYAYRARAKDVQLHVQFSGLRVASDLRLLRRILFNITANAVRYTASGSITVRAHAEADEVVLTVVDTGVGIAPAELPYVFDDFRRSAQGRVDDTEGLGLGLAIVRRACALLGHMLSIESVPGQGTAVQLRLKRAEDAREEARAASGASPLAPQKRHTILIIENDLEALRALSELLTLWNHDCIALASADDLASALDSIQTISAVVSDLHLDRAGGEDGLMLIDSIRRHLGRASLPALLVTGDIDPDLGRRAAAAGVVLAHKPLSPQQLRRELDALLAPDNSRPTS
ncbi:MAG: hypothetical protein KA795_16195 [Burkholderiaceae bacterium]|nr:hypothetical protein [Burkholderiaceae bacterium]